jgi:hypothetical protein
MAGAQGAECTATKPAPAKVQAPASASAAASNSHIFDDAEVVEADGAAAEALPTMQTNFQVK